jgi:ferritin-like metal-binding protein YciE
VTQNELSNALAEYVQGARDREQTILGILDIVLPSVKDQDMLRGLRAHRDQTKRHAQLLEQRLKALGRSVKKCPAQPVCAREWLSGWNDTLTIYGLLENLARTLGDEETVTVIRKILKDEETMAAWVEERLEPLNRVFV